MSTHVSSKPKRTYQTWLEQSVLSSQIGAYSSYLSDHGYSNNTVGFYLHSVAHFSHWLTRKKIGLDCINEAMVRRFITVHLPVCDCAGRCGHQVPTVQAALGHLLRVLRSKECIPSRIGSVARAVREELDRFDTYLDRVCGLASTTRLNRAHYASKFLSYVCKGDSMPDLTHLKPKDIQQFVTRHGEGCTTGSIQVICSCLRTYLRFRAFEGDRIEALIAAVPRIPNWRLAPLPKALTDQELKQFLAAFDRTTSGGQRDYAMARCLVDLGLRSAEVAHLQLSNFDWREGTLQITGSKGGHADILPLPVQTGRAIVQYLRNARPKYASQLIFTRHLAPRDRPITPTIVRWAMRRAYVRSGLTKPRFGSHMLRHTIACRLINAGGSLKEIADVLRHKSLDATTIYTKVDLKKLSAVALPWLGRMT